MHLHVIICFALVIWWPEERPFDPAIGSPLWTWVVVWGQVPLLFLAAAAASAAALRRLEDTSGGPQQAQHFYHRAVMILRLATVLGLAAALLVTDWVSVVRSIRLVQKVPGMADLLVLAPFFAAAVLVFVGTYRIDQALHQVILENRQWEGRGRAAAWTLGRYLNFNLRHHLLVVVVPMILILVAFDLSRTHEQWLNRVFQVAWAAEVAPGVAAAGIFVIAPLILRYIWPTHRLPDGPLRRRLEEICRRIKLRYRDILIWQSGGMMINAAVMGLFGPVRYVMLSDGLLEAMSREQIEAVFGHEAGHVRHRHIQFFLLFAVCSMLFLSAVVEALRLSVEKGLLQMDMLTIQAVGGICVAAFWGVGFGWVSRRFERQADVFGARCVTPARTDQCGRPCGVHDEHQNERPSAALCAAGAAVFASALDRVALLNGIPHKERSWRHSSITSRIRFLISLSGDPGRVRRFEQLVRRIKAALLILAVGGSAVAAIYVWDHPIYGIRRVSQPRALRPLPMRTSVRSSSCGHQQGTPSMPARIIDGRAVAARIRRQTAAQARQLRDEGVEVRLDTVIVGDPEAGVIYAHSQQARCSEVGIQFRSHRLPAKATNQEVLAFLSRLNLDPQVTGVLVNLPLPEGINTAAIQYGIDPYKDVEGVNPANIGFVFYDCPIIAPCTALAVMEILKEVGCHPRGLRAVVVGQGAIAGRPTTLFLLQQMATVTACHDQTRNLATHTRAADLLIVAAGVPGLIRGDHVKPGAVVIDVGINRAPDGHGGTKIVGDVLFDEVKEVAGALTPVPGGVGPVTVAILLRSAVQAARKQLGRRGAIG